MSSDSSNLNLNPLPLLGTLWGYRKVLLAVTLIAGISAAIVTLFITPKYKATAIIFPPAANQVSKELFTENKQEGITVFGDTQEAEQFLQILTSRTLKDSVIARLNLAEHWDIKSGKGYKSKVYNRYNSNIRVRPTRYQSVVIEVMDPDPEMAARIANTIVDISDSTMRSVKAQVARKALVALEQQYELALTEIRSLEDSLTRVMQSGVVHLKMQTEQLYKAYINALVSGNTRSMTKLQPEFNRLKAYGSRYERFRNEIQDMAFQLTQIRQSLKVARVEAQQQIPSQFIIDRAIAPDKKATPKRILLTVIATLSALFFTILIIIVTDYAKRAIPAIKGESER